VMKAVWKKRFSILLNRLYLYPEPEPLPHMWLFWLATGLVTLAVVVFCSYFILYLTGQHDAIQTNAEDLGIMDQAIWNTVHGNMLHQTVCNIIHDTNCYSNAGITRFAIHVEPILFPISLLYYLLPNPKTLIVLQIIVVGLGAYPAFWLARLRLRNDLIAVPIAVLYLLYPAQQQAIVFDFHAVTLTASLLFFMLYFMYTRRTAWIFIFAVLAMACKEEIPILIVMLGVWSMIFQQRWRTGLALIILGGVWASANFLFIVPHFSPTGKPLLVGRYADLGKGPLAIISNIVLHPGSFVRNYILEHDRFTYLRTLFAPAAYLPLLAPWVLLLALPTLAINMLSSYPQMYSGQFQYSAEIVPVLIFAAIEALVVIRWFIRFVIVRWKRRAIVNVSSESAWLLSADWQPVRLVQTNLLLALLALMLFFSLRADYYFHGHLPFSQGFSWPSVTAHALQAQHFINMIPPTASVSAQSKLVPQISHRESIYLFPYQRDEVEYIFLDVTSDIYPYYTTSTYVEDVKSLLLGGKHTVVAAQDGYLLLKRDSAHATPTATGTLDPTHILVVAPHLPESFCSYIYAAPQEVVHPLDVTFTGKDGSLDLVGFDVRAPDTFHYLSDYMSITTYWHVVTPISTALIPVFFLNGQDQKEYFASNDVPTIFWCQTNVWKPGMVVKITTRVFGLQRLPVPKGLAYMSVALLPFTPASGTMVNVGPIEARLPVHMVNAPKIISVLRDVNAVQLMPMNLVP